MSQDEQEAPLVVDSVVLKAVKDLQEHAHAHPEDRSVKIALAGILDGLLQATPSADVDKEGKLLVRHLQDLARLFPDSPIPLLHLSKACLDRDDYEAALGHAEAGLLVAPAHQDLIFNRALSLEELGRNDEAIAGFTRYLELNPDNPWAFNNIGDAYRKQRLYDQAENYFKLALAVDKHFSPAHYNLAMVFMDQREWARCVYHASIAERYQPSNKEIQLVLGNGYMGLHEHELALQHLVRATMIDPSFVEAYETMSSAYVELGMYKLSIAAGEEALKLNPDSWMALANIGYCYSRQGRYEDAIRIERDALQRDPDDEGRYKLSWALGWNYLQIDKPSEALEYTDAAIQMREYPDPILSFNRGLILLAQGKIREAEKAYEVATGSASVIANYETVLEGMSDVRDYIRRKGVQVDKASSLFKFIQGGAS